MEHLLHGGLYARTARIAAGMAFTSVLIRIPTVVILAGRCCIYCGDRWQTLEGYHVIPASGQRIQAYATLAETAITMLFPTRAKTVAEAEAEFTEDAGGLLSRRRPEDELITITGA